MSDRSRSVARAQFLGTQRIDIGNEIITPEAERLFGMLVRLSVPLGRITSRQTMMDTLWPGSDEANARHNLRQTVYKAREVGLIVESGEDGLRLDPRHWSCDWDDPTGDVPGEWLPDYFPEWSEELAAWVTAQRVGVHAMIRPRIIRALQTARSAGELVLADRYAVQLLDIDTLNEEATLTRAELMAMQGAKVDALRLLDAYLAEIGRVGGGRDAALPAQLLRRRIAEKLPAVTYQSAGKHHGPLIGRQSESKRLMAALFDARAGRGSGILVQGPDGTGKSRLLFEVRKSACLHGVRVIEAVTNATPNVVPFAALRCLVTRLLELPGAIGVSPESLAALRAWIVSNEVAPDDCPAFEIEDLLASVSEETPLLMLFEHAERMDAETLGQLDRVYRRGVQRHHMLILTSATQATPTEAPVALQWIERVSLRPMDLADVRSIVAAWSAAELPRAKADQIACASVFAEGVPMYGIEMLGLMLDSGSPDVIPWRVQVAVDRAMRELSELQWRVLALCGLLGASARQSVVAASLKVEEMELAMALDLLEAFGFVHWEGGVGRVSGLMSDAARVQVRDSILRLDAHCAAELTRKEWTITQHPEDFYTCLRLFIAAKDERSAHATFDSGIGDLVRNQPAQQLLFTLTQLRNSSTTTQFKCLLEATIIHLRNVVEPKASNAPRRAPGVFPSSLPTVSEGESESEFTLISAATFERAERAARDPQSSPAGRLVEAVQALVAAANLGDDAALLTAFQAVNAVRYAPGINAFDLHRADLIYHVSTGNRDLAMASAEHLVGESRVVRDVRLACLGFRNAAEAYVSVGDFARAQSVLHESRQIATRLNYTADLARTDIRLAELALSAMDHASADAYLDSAARTIDSSRLRVPLILTDLHLYRCWAAIVRGDTTKASKSGRAMCKAMRCVRVGVPKFVLLGVRLATHKGRPTRELLRDFESLKNSIGIMKHDATEQYSLAALVLSSKAIGKHQETSMFVRAQLDRIAQHRTIWPFLRDLIDS